MECILFIGLQGSGKSSFYKERFFNSHVRISMDLMRNRRREQRFLDACLEAGQRFVVDNTNPTKAERLRYIAAAKAARFSVVGYYFPAQAADCLARNALRTGKERVPDVGILATAKKLERPEMAEGFDRLFVVRMREGGGFDIEDWNDEVR